MAEPARTAVVIKDFPGMVTNGDQFDLPAGAADEQVNACSLKVGELTVRLGYRIVSFDAET